jgi:hypothetical protein
MHSFLPSSSSHLRRREYVDDRQLQRLKQRDAHAMGGRRRDEPPDAGQRRGRLHTRDATARRREEALRHVRTRLQQGEETREVVHAGTAGRIDRTPRERRCTAATPNVARSAGRRTERIRSHAERPSAAGG